MELIKIGGSVANELFSLIPELKSLNRNILIIPGGWVFADLVREADEKYKLDEKNAHWMAIACMDVYGYFISSYGVETVIAKNFADLRDVKGVKVVLLHSLLKQDEEFTKLPCSWDVTSDSISIWMTSKLGIDRIIKVTNVDGVFVNNELVKSITASELLNLNIETCVDSFAPQLLKKYKIDMFVCNTKEVKDYILKGKAKGTLIRGE